MKNYKFSKYDILVIFAFVLQISKLHVIRTIYGHDILATAKKAITSQDKLFLN